MKYIFLSLLLLIIGLQLPYYMNLIMIGLSVIPLIYGIYRKFMNALRDDYFRIWLDERI